MDSNAIEEVHTCRSFAPLEGGEATSVPARRLLRAIELSRFSGPLRSYDGEETRSVLQITDNSLLKTVLQLSTDSSWT